MEQQLFDWQDWDKLDTSSFLFYKIKLVREIKEFPVGTEFDSAVVDFENGILQLCRKEENGNNFVKEFKLKLEIED